MNPLETLRTKIYHDLLAKDVPFYMQETALRPLDEFIAGHEVVEVYENAPLVCEPLKGGVFRQWHNDMRQHLSTARRLTIIVPRAEPPSLLAAAEAVWERITLTERHRSVGATVCSDMGGALDALAQAIKRAREGNE